MQSVDITKMFHGGIRNIYYAIVFQILQYVGASQQNFTYLPNSFTARKAMKFPR